jgi:capsular polysaccharide biosynthesis protein
MDHFGHVLRDALARLWFIRERPDLPVLWHRMDDLPVPHAAWPGWLDQLWRLLGLDRHRHLHLTVPVAVDRVLLPDPGVIACDVLHPAQARALAVRACSAPCDGAPAWLSRAGLPAGFGGFAGEAEVEARLAAKGWRILRPETLSLAAQADLFATARVVAGTIGSAFHAALLCATPRAGLVLVHRPGIDHMFYDAVARARGLRQAYVVPALTAGGTFHAWARFTLADPAGLAAAVMAAAERVS